MINTNIFDGDVKIIDLNALTYFLNKLREESSNKYILSSNVVTNSDINSIFDKVIDTLYGQITDDNTILLFNNLQNDIYTLKYVDSGGNSLNNYSDICTLSINGENVEYLDFIKENIPPYQAEAIGIYNSNDEKVGTIQIDNFKPEFGERLYRFGLLSDVHDYEGSPAEASDDFFKVLDLFNSKEDVELTCICGDITQDGTEEEYEFYSNDVKRFSPNTPVYATPGNHDATREGLNEEWWNKYVGTPRTFEFSKTLANGSVDHFLFLGMYYWNFYNAYLPEDIEWLSNKLEEYKNDRCFVFTHLFFPDRAGNMNNVYPSYNWLAGEQLDILRGLNDRYVNSIWFSGHSHWKWELQKYQDRANIYRVYDSKNKPISGWNVHVPSCAQPIDSNGSSREQKNLEAQGAVVDVYENYIDIRGIDIKNNKYLPIATYRLDTIKMNVE